MLRGQDLEDQDDKNIKPRASIPTKTRGGDSQSPGLILLQQGSDRGFDMLSNNREGRFPIHIEANAPQYYVTPQRYRRHPTDDMQQSIADENDYAPASSGRDRRTSRPQSRKAPDQKRPESVRAYEKDGKDPAATHEQRGRGHEDRLQPHIPTPRPLTSTVETGLRCYNCGRTETPQWRTGPEGPLCNVCGLLWNKRHSRRQKKSLSH
ncbi:hypothetical protein CC79DRAFT_1337157 [Sarocladium strictum]